MSAAEVVGHMAEVVELVTHTPDGETFRVSLVERVAELEAELERALRDVEHYKTVVRLLCHKFAAAPL